MRYCLVALVFVIGGCSGRSHVEQVARDWCLTLRASQIIPIYPMSEDVQPGDIFIVDVPTGRQHELYEGKGFMPLDQHIARLAPTAYSQWYGGSHGTDKNAVPHYWKFGGKADSLANYIWAPVAGFPSYGFRVKTGSTFSMALPVHGIPVGMSLLGATDASCSVTIRKAYTYGLGAMYMEDAARTWAADNQAYLKAYAPRELPKKWWQREAEERPYYLRVITRVYLAREMSVAVTSDKAAGVGVTAGLSTPAHMVSADPNSAGKNYEAVMSALNKNLEGMPDLKKDAVPGGAPLPRFGASLSVVGASSRSVSINETFERPLVIGYIAIDFKIDKEGRLGGVASSRSVLETGKFVPSGIEYGESPKSQRIKAWLDEPDTDEGKQARRVKLNEWLQARNFGVHSVTAWLNSANEPGRDSQYQEAIDEFNIP